MGNKANTSELTQFELGPELTQQLEQAFDRFDIDGNGKIEKHEI